MTNTAPHAHEHSDDHAGHSHGPGGHTHAPANFGPAFAVGIVLNTAFVLIEAGFGVVSHSVALIADAGHNLSDVLGLAVAWVAAILVRRAPKGRFTYGLRGSSILAALFNAVFLLVAIGAIAVEAVQRFIQPEPVGGVTVMVVAGVGILINGVTAWLSASGRKGDLNIRGAFLHMLSDCPGLGWRRRRGSRDPSDWVDLARPNDQPRYRSGALLRHVGAAAGLRWHEPAGCAPGCGRGEVLSD